MINANQITHRMIDTYRFVQEYYYQEDVIARLKELGKDTKDAALMTGLCRYLSAIFRPMEPTGITSTPLSRQLKKTSKGARRKYVPQL